MTLIRFFILHVLFLVENELAKKIIFCLVYEDNLTQFVKNYITIPVQNKDNLGILSKLRHTFLVWNKDSH